MVENNFCHVMDQKYLTSIYLFTYYRQYFIIVALVFVTMLIGGVLGYVFRERVQQTMRQVSASFFEDILSLRSELIRAFVVLSLGNAFHNGFVWQST